MSPRRRNSRWNCTASPSLRQALQSWPNRAKERQTMIRLTSNCRQSFNMGLPKGLINFRQDTAKIESRLAKLQRSRAMERQVNESKGPMDLGSPLRPLSPAGLEILLAALDPLLDGFGEGPSCLDDARAYLERLAASTGPREEGTSETETGIMEEWIEAWRAAGGNRQTLRLMVQTLLGDRLEREKNRKIDREKDKPEEPACGEKVRIV